MSRFKGFTNKFQPGQRVCRYDDEGSAGTVVSSGRDRRAVIDWDAGGRTTELWCNVRFPGPIITAGIPFPNLDPGPPKR